MKTTKSTFKMMLVIFLAWQVLLLTGCTEDDPDPDDPTQVTVETKIEATPSVPLVGEEIILDGSSTVIEPLSAVSGLTYQWSIVSEPSGSTTSLANPDAIITTFTPDVDGVYELSLEVIVTANGTEVSDTEVVSLTVMNPDFIELSGTISENRTLSKVSEEEGKLDYLVTGDVNVLAELTIEPGVIIHFTEGKTMSISSAGVIKAEGTAADSIVMTSSNKAGEVLWKGLYIASPSALNKLKYVDLSYAGSSNFNFTGDDYKAGVGVESTGNISIENSSFSNNDGYAVYVDDQGGQLNVFENNAISDNENGVAIWAEEVSDINGTSLINNNQIADVEIFSSSLEESTTATWNALQNGAAYTVSGGITINGDLTLSPGVNLEMDEDVQLTVNGSLIADGTSDNRITLTSKSADQGILWKSLYFASSDSRNKLNYVDVSFAGNSNINFTGTDYKAAVGIEANGKVSVTNSTLNDNDGYALYMDDQGGQLEDFFDNSFARNEWAVGLPADEVDALDAATTFSDNTGDVEIFASTYAESNASSWPSLSNDTEYTVSGNLKIDGDLTIDPGAIFTMDEDVLITVGGSLGAVGTASDRITFTTSNLAGAIHWKAIYFTSSSSLNKLDYVDVSYAGNSKINFTGTDYAVGVGVEVSGKLSIKNSTVNNNLNYGLYVDDQGGLLEDFENNSFSNNLRGVGVPVNEVEMIDSNSTFTSNSFAEVEIFATSLSSEKSATWSALDGDASYRITGNIILDGDVTIMPGAKFEIDEDVQVYVNGAFIANGSDGSNIVFTSANISGNILWKGFFFASANSQNSFDFAEISYAGNSNHNLTGPDFAANIAVDAGANLSVTNSIVSQSGGYGIYSIGTTNDFSLAAAGNTFTNNLLGNN